MHPLYQIDIPKRSNTCHHGGESLLPGMEYYSQLLDEDNHQFVRRDYCLGCWEDQLNKQESKGGYWKSRIDVKQQAPKTIPPRVERGLALLKKLTEQNERNEQEIYILALFLAHARRIVLRREFEEQGQAFALYEIVHQDEFVTVKKMDLNSLEIGALQKALSEKLNQVE